MADPRTFTLIGSFQDGITPELTKINESISALKRNLGGFGAKRGGFNDLTLSMGKVIGAHIRLKEQVIDLRKELTNSLTVLKDYRQEMGKASRANFAMGRSSTGVKSLTTELDNARNSATRLKTTMKGLTTRERPAGTIPQPRATQAAQYAPAMPSVVTRKGGKGGTGAGGVDIGGGGYAGAVSGAIIGEQLGDIMSTAIVKGFQIGVDIMQRPFQFLAGALKERRADEMSDIRAAGGLFSIARRMDEPFVKTFEEAEKLTQANNLYLAQLAGTLPGRTQEYVQVAKQMSDGIYQSIVNDKENSIALANKFAREAGRPEIVAKTGSEAIQKAGTEIIGEMTKLTVLAGLGGRQGPYGLPQLTERMLSQDQVSMGQFQRYSAIFRDPMIMGALERNIDNINSTAKSTAARTEALANTFKEIVTPELIARFRRSVDGMLEGLNTAFFEPEVGLFGLGRKLTNVTYRMNVFGEYLDEFGNVTSDTSKYVKESQGIFDLLRNSFGDIILVLTPLAEMLPQIYDPLAALGKELSDIRKYTSWFLRSFEFYKKGLMEFANTFSDSKIKEAFKLTVPARAALSAIAAVLLKVGAINMGEFKDLGKKLENVDINLGDILKGLVDKFMKSKAAYNIGSAIGRVVGTVVAETGKFMSQLAGLTTAGPLAKGISEGFKAAKGPEGIKNIFKSVFGMIGRLFMEIVSAAPLESLFIAGFLTLPGLIAGVVAEAMRKVFSKEIKIPDVQNKIDKARSLYNLDKAKPKPVGNLAPLIRTEAPKSAVFRATKESRIVNPQFPGVALGTTPGVGGVTGPYRAPKVPKAPKAPQGMKWIKEWLMKAVTGGDYLLGGPKTKDLGKNLKIAGKGLKVQITSIAKNALPATGNFLKGVQGRMGAGGMTGLKNPLGMLGKFGGALTILVGVIEGVSKLLSGGSIWEALGAGAGSIIGTIVGTAIAGPIGDMIGAWIGSSKAMVEPLSIAFRDLGDAVGYAGKLFVQIGGDLQGMARGIPGVSKEFDLLRWTITVLLSPLSLLKLAVLGIYEAYLNLKEKIPGLGLTPEEKATRDSMAEERRKSTAELQNRLDPRSLGDQIKGVREEITKIKTVGFGGDQKTYEKSLRLGLLPGSQALWAAENRLKLLYEQEKKSRLPQTPGTPATATAPKPGTPAAAAPAIVAPPAAVTAQAQAVTATAKATQQINQKAGAQIAQAAGINKNTSAANTTLGNIKVGIMAVSNKITGMQTALVQSLLQVQMGSTAIYGLLASGSLKVQSSGGMGGMGGGLFGLGSPSDAAGMAKVTEAGKMLQGMGLNVAENPNFGTGRVGKHAEGSYHYKGRAIDVTGSEAALDEAYAKLKNTNPAELLWRTAGHYDHLHVAYATGMPTVFSNYADALSFEKKATMGNVKISSITAREGEFGGSSPTTVTNNISITQQPGQSADELASIVALKIGEAVADARAASIFV